MLNETAKITNPKEELLDATKTLQELDVYDVYYGTNPQDWKTEVLTIFGVN